MTIFTAPFCALKRLTKRYKSDHQGVAAIELQISHATNVAGDLATQVASIDAAQMSEIMTATTLVMGVPSNEIGDVKLEIASFSRNAETGDTIPLGTATLNGPFSAPFNADSLDDLILSSTSGVVVARVEYDYEPLKLRYFDSNFTLSETFLLKPRVAANVQFDKDFSCSSDGFKATCS